MHPLTQLIQAAYPSPSRANPHLRYDARPGAYCIGGAVCLYFPTAVSGLTARNFPSPMDLADWLQVLNPALTQDAAHDYASRIIHNNDAEAFDRAWQLLDQALRYEEVVNDTTDPRGERP